ncbi:unnamed protein product [Prorocentrum cordatum]|uniref:Uncharacterized protein n=1 Tax=Prorocentrum cordatum TaxID=2364126 RepID=A0ABN9SH08_9DINO|nr:unnamed protein product [Polarella glacialis]
MAAPRPPPVRPARALCAAAVWAGWHWRTAAGAVLEGDFPAVDGDMSLFLGKFCFDYDRTNSTPAGRLLLNMTFAQESLPSQGKLYFMVFDDEKKHWKDAWRGWNEGDCEYKKQMSSKFDEVKMTGKDLKHRYSLNIKEGLRPRFWYRTALCGA